MGLALGDYFGAEPLENPGRIVVGEGCWDECGWTLRRVFHGGEGSVELVTGQGFGAEFLENPGKSVVEDSGCGGCGPAFSWGTCGGGGAMGW